MSKYLLVRVYTQILEEQMIKNVKDVARENFELKQKLFELQSEIDDKENEDSGDDDDDDDDDDKSDDDDDDI